MSATADVRSDEAALDLPAAPQPVLDADTAPFWAATARGELALCRCADCRAWTQPPTERCRYCAGPTEFEPAAGRGRVHSFIVVRHASVPGFGHLLPYAIVLVTLEEGVRLSGRLLGDPAAALIGREVQARTERLPGSEHHAVVFEAVGVAPVST